MFAEKRKRRDNKDEFKAAEQKNRVFAGNVKDMARGKRRPFKMAALARMKLRPHFKGIRLLKTKVLVSKMGFAIQHRVPLIKNITCLIRRR